MKEQENKLPHNIYCITSSRDVRVYKCFVEGNYPIYATSTANRLAVSSAVNMEAKLNEMLAEARKSRKE